jgi:hypothetical protein
MKTILKVFSYVVVYSFLVYEIFIQDHLSEGTLKDVITWCLLLLLIPAVVIQIINIVNRVKSRRG